MLKHLCPIILTTIAPFWINCPVSAQDKPPTSFVDPFIGTAPNSYVKTDYSMDTGNVYPGAVCPRGMVAWSPDTTHNQQIAGGYWYPDDKIEDFSLTHFSGRGVPCLKDIAFMPLVRNVGASPGTAWAQYAASFSHQNESAAPGYYQVKFDNGVETELTATPRTGMARFHFPAQSMATLLIRANGSVTVNGNNVSGRADWEHNRPKVYFFAQFDQPIKSAKTWIANKIGDTTAAEGPKSGVILTFDASTDPVVQVRVGISYTSQENAEDNLKQENTGWNFTALQKNAVALWNDVLGRIQVQGGTEEATKVFYTAIYRCFIHPNILDDANGQYLGIDRKVHSVEAGHHQYQNIPAWDEHRSHSPLMAILASNESSDVMQSLVNYTQQDAGARSNGGGLPRWEQVNTNSGGMTGDGDDTIIAGSYAFGATQFDTRGAWKAMDKGASQPGVTSDGHMVREGLHEYKTLGYVPESASMTLEYCNDDFALSQFAQSMGEHQKSADYLNRAQNWKNLFDPSTSYIRSRSANGTWVEDFSPTNGIGFTEGTCAQYLWMVNFNLRALIDKIGGNRKAVERLDHFFTKTNDGPRSEFAFMGNEPCEEVPWIYDFAAAPSHTQEVVRRIQTELFTTLPDGFPGNDDAGALSSWYVFSALGLYPEIPGVAGFVVGSPVFPKATVHLENGKAIQIIGEQSSLTNPYVQSLTINNQNYESPWIPWSLLSNGAVLDFHLTDKPSVWGEDPKKAPPSFNGNVNP